MNEQERTSFIQSKSLTKTHLLRQYNIISLYNLSYTKLNTHAHSRSTHKRKNRIHCGWLRLCVRIYNMYM